MCAACVSSSSEGGAAPHTLTLRGGSAGPESRGPVRSKIRPASREIRCGFQVERGGKRCCLEHEEAFVLSVSAGMEEAEAGP